MRLTLKSKLAALTQVSWRFQRKVADTYLPKIMNGNAQGEYYLTDLVSLCAEDGLQIDYLLGDENEVQGVNSRADLAAVEAYLQHRLRHAAMAKGQPDCA